MKLFLCKIQSVGVVNMKSNVFRKKSLDRIASPEQLNDYIRVSKPSIWLILSALIIIIVSVIIWSISGNITTKVSVNAIVKSSADSPDTLICYVLPENASSIKKNMNVNICGLYASDNRYITGKVSNIVNVKITRDDIGEISPDAWSSEMLVPDNVEYVVPVAIKIDKDQSSSDGYKWVDGDVGDSSFVAENNICKAHIIIESVSPISFLFNQPSNANRGA